MMKIIVPEISLVVLVGVSGSGKSTFARKYFLPPEIVSSDACRAIVSNEENNQEATQDAFDVLYYILRKRLRRGLLTVVDATNVQIESRKKLLAIAKEFHAMPVAIVLDTDEKICHSRNQSRANRDFGPHVIRNQKSQLRRSYKSLKREGFRFIYTLKTEEEANQVTIERAKMWNNKKEEVGPFDIIGDIHGCYDELRTLLAKLGYTIQKTDQPENYGYSIEAPENRKVIFVGDLVDRGPKSPEVLKLTMAMVQSDKAFCVPGNHDVKLLKKLNGKNVQMKHGLAETWEQLENEPASFKEALKKFIDGLISHLIFDEGKLVVAHAGIREEMQGRGSKAVRAFCLYGETTGEIDEYGLPVRYNWAKEYRGSAMVVYGHTPIPQPEWLNNTINIDTACVFGGSLTALRYPERELVSVKAQQEYYEPSKPLEVADQSLSAQQEYDDLLYMEDVQGKRIVSTRLRSTVTIREENAIAALEVMSRFALHPKWLAYLPPTMAPSETSNLPDYLEYPQEAFDYYAQEGVQKVICEEKHMGSRAVLIVAKNEEAILKTFGLSDQGIGVIYTRTGRAFFNNKETEQALLKRVQNALGQSGFWDKLQTEWVILDCELMPWSAKAQALLQSQYAAVASASALSVPMALEVIQQTAQRGVLMEDLPEIYHQRLGMVQNFRQAYRQYCWEVKSLDDYQIAPFHILATEGKAHTDKTHLWHMEMIHTFSEGFPSMKATNYKIIDLNEEKSIQMGTDWWLALTEKGGEGMVIKPLDFITQGNKDIVQPALKCRGREYLRIIYGPEYLYPKNLAKLKKRGLGAKRSLALREFALGVEALEKFVSKEPLRKIHECVFGVLALESEPVDPRL